MLQRNELKLIKLIFEEISPKHAIYKLAIFLLTLTNSVTSPNASSVTISNNANKRPKCVRKNTPDLQT